MVDSERNRGLGNMKWGAGGRERIQEAEAGEGRRQSATYQPHDNTTDLPHNSVCTMPNTAASVYTDAGLLAKAESFFLIQIFLRGFVSMWSIKPRICNDGER